MASGDGTVEKEGGGNVHEKSADGGKSTGGVNVERDGGNIVKKKRRAKKAKLSQHGAGEAGAPAESSPQAVNDEERTTVRPSDGKTVSAKDGRIVAAGNDLKKQYPNHYRNADNTKAFYGRYLNLGEAFKLACLVQYGPNLPIETSGYTSMRKALFRTAAYYALSDGEAKQIMSHPTIADFLYFLVKSAKQLVYSYTVDARLIFGDAVFSRHPPAGLLRGTSNIVTVSVHYAETV
jgi:hypothetical protein